MQDPYQYRLDRLYCEDVDLEEIARAAGTPCYVYSQSAILERFHAYDRGLSGVPHTICYAVKANSNLSVLKLLAEAGAGFDIVSGGELYRVLQAGGDPRKVVFSGVGKTAGEIEFALEQGILSFNCESEGELHLLNELAGKRERRPHVALRVNPDVDAATHPYISTGMSEHKFGIDGTEIEDVYGRANLLRHLHVNGVSCHIGSQLLNAAPVLEAVDRVLDLIGRLRSRGIAIEHIDIGGGLGVPYRPEEIRPDLRAFLGQLRPKLESHNVHVLLEPGRSIVAEAGVLLTRVLYRKATPHKEFVIVDAAMNDLIRPSLYQSHHEIVPLRRSAGRLRADVVGPVCESGDFLARDREMACVNPGDLLAIRTAGAYGFVQSSNYNSRPRSAEVLVTGKGWRIARKRESYADLVRGELVPHVQAE